LKWVVSEVAQRHDLHASFMPKPIFGVAGSGMHIHQSLGDENGAKNLFCDTNSQYGLSDLARHFIAGQLAHARGMSAILAPLVNSYKRLVAGYEAPVHLSWARVNHSALIRVPETAPDTPETTRVELRMPDPSCNPYLAFAVMLGAGLDGIARELPLPEPIEESLYAFGPQRSDKFNVRLLPANLKEALDELAKDEVICDLLGPVLLERFLEAKRMEWEDYRVQVTPWEIVRYLRTH
ncbi:MAG TPA: glutamine synthetase, partial [Tepidiformaceae bacterium]